MDAETVLRIKPSLTRYLHEYDGCMGRVTNCGHRDRYILGQLSNLERKSIEPMADAAGVAPRTLQEFLSLLRWDEGAMRDRLQRRVVRQHNHPHSVGIIDETSFHKQGNKTACVQRQYCGSRGKVDNCVVSVHLGYAAGDFHTLLDGELYLPQKTWHQNRTRCRAAGIPEDVVYRAKWQIALGQVQRALGNGVRFSWLTFDEYYGGKPPFLRSLDALGQNYVAEIPVNFVGWTKPPEVLHRPHDRDTRKDPSVRRLRLKVRNTPACQVRNLLTYSPVLRSVPWVKYRVKDGSKGPMVWEAKCVPFWIKDENGLPSRPHRLLVVRNVLKPDEVKFFLSNAPAAVPTEMLLLVAFSRWRVERMFQDSKSELGMDHFEVRTYLSIQRHLILSCVSHLFLAEFHLEHRGKKHGADRIPTVHGDGPTRPHLVSRRAMLTDRGPIHQRAVEANPAPHCPCTPQPPETHFASIARQGHQIERATHLPMVQVLAL